MIFKIIKYSCISTVAILISCGGEPPVYESNAEVEFRGSLYYANSEAGCTGCHGNNWDGDGARGSAVRARGLTPTDFTAELPADKTVVDFFKAITMGTEDMPDHAYQFHTDRARWAMAHFLYSLSPEPSDREGKQNRQAALRADMAEAKAAYSDSRRWDLGYTPVADRSRAPSVDDLIEQTGFNIVESRTVELSEERREKAIAAQSRPELERGRTLYQQNCLSCHGTFAQGGTEGRRLGLLWKPLDPEAIENPQPRSNAYLGTNDLQDSAALNSVESFRNAHNEWQHILPSFTAFTESEWTEIYQYVREITE